MDALMFVRRVIMKTRLFKWLLTATVLFCLSFVVTNAIAKKPPPKDDPCLSQQSFTPDFAFYRDTGKGKVRTFTFFVADAKNGCEIKLVDFTRGEGLIHALSYSSTKEGDGSYLGRIVWRTNLSPGNFRVVWGYDFSINGTDVGDIRDPYRVMDNYEDTNKNITSMDLSPDRKTLAYHFYISGADSSIRMVNIDACVDNNRARWILTTVWSSLNQTYLRQSILNRLRGDRLESVSTTGVVQGIKLNQNFSSCNTSICRRDGTVIGRSWNHSYQQNQHWCQRSSSLIFHGSVR